MNTKKIIKYILYGIILSIGIFIGWLFSSSHYERSHYNEKDHSGTIEQVWTCSMHPQIRQDKPGKCPICAMDLVPLKSSGMKSTEASFDAIQLSDEAIALANIQTTIVSRGNPVKEIRLYGTIKSDERLLRSQVSHVNGRIENLIVNTVGETIRYGQVIATVYSPDLINAQQELLEAQKLAGVQPDLLNAAREKLHLWKLTDNQISEIERTGIVSPVVNITANVSGIVTAKRVEQGDYVNQGSVLFDLEDLSSVWAVFDAYEADLPYLKTGDKVEYTLQSLPGKVFSGKISFIDPILNKTTRTAKIRVETVNTKLELKPEMYTNGIIKVVLKNYINEIVIPKTSVLWTGKRSIVYVKQPETNTHIFKLREIELGVSLGEEYIVLSGIKNGEEIVTNGTFSIDASAQLEGKRSMMNIDIPYSNVKYEEYNSMTSMLDNVTEHAMLKVQGNCDMCKSRIEKAAKSVNGVSFAIWDSKTKMLHLNYDRNKTTLDIVSKAVSAAGHDTDRHKSDDKVYNSLPECCQYRK